MTRLGWFFVGFLLLAAIVGPAVRSLVQRFALDPTNPPAGCDNVTKCRSNETQIWKALCLYANDHEGRTPDSLEELITEDLTPAVYICPSAGDEASTQPTTAPTEQEANIRSAGFPAGLHDPCTQPRQCSYIYLAAGRPWHEIPADTVILYEPLAHHVYADRSVVLFRDGSTRFLSGREIEQKLAASTQPASR